MQFLLSVFILCPETVENHCYNKLWVITKVTPDTERISALDLIARGLIHACYNSKDIKNIFCENSC